MLTPRPPDLLVLNEPETSLHGSLIAPLARLIVQAGERSQLVVTTHSQDLARELELGTRQPATVLSRRNGATVVAS